MLTVGALRSRRAAQESTELIAISGAARSNDAVNVWLITAQAHDTIALIASERETAILAKVVS